LSTKTLKLSGSAVPAQQWGTVNVTMQTTSNGKAVTRRFTDLGGGYTYHTSRSQFIMSQALPILRQEFLKARLEDPDGLGRDADEPGLRPVTPVCAAQGARMSTRAKPHSTPQEVHVMKHHNILALAGALTIAGLLAQAATASARAAGPSAGTIGKSPPSPTAVAAIRALGLDEEGGSDVGGGLPGGRVACRVRVRGSPTRARRAKGSPNNSLHAMTINGAERLWERSGSSRLPSSLGRRSALSGAFP
jgi:hypothetical protein